MVQKKTNNKKKQEQQADTEHSLRPRPCSTHLTILSFIPCKDPGGRLRIIPSHELCDLEPQFPYLYMELITASLPPAAGTWEKLGQGQPLCHSRPRAPWRGHSMPLSLRFPIHKAGSTCRPEPLRVNRLSHSKVLNKQM